MAAATVHPWDMHPWLRPTWLPELELIKWERLARLRLAQAPLFAVYRGSLSSVPALERKFAAEDEAQRTALLDAARSGAPDPEIAVTSELRRRVDLELASERAAPALLNLAEHVIATVIELCSNWREAGDAYDEAFGRRPRAEREAEAFEFEGTVYDALDGGVSVEEANTRLEQLNRQRPRPPFITPTKRSQIEAEWRSLEVLRAGPLSANGINTIGAVRSYVAKQTGEDLGTSDDLERHLRNAYAEQAGEVVVHG